MSLDAIGVNNRDRTKARQIRQQLVRDTLIHLKTFYKAQGVNINFRVSQLIRESRVHYGEDIAQKECDSEGNAIGKSEVQIELLKYRDHGIVTDRLFDYCVVIMKGDLLSDATQQMRKRYIKYLAQGKKKKAKRRH